MKPCEMPLTCELCSEDAVFCDSVPDPSKTGNHAGECGYRLQPLCWLHGRERKQVTVSRVDQVLRCVRQGISRLDRDRCGGDCLCPECGRKYYDHPHDQDHPHMHVLCDGSAVKL